MKLLWAEYHFADPNYFAETVNYLHLPAYTLLWLGSIFLGGGYERPFDLGRLLRSLGVGTLLLFAIYGLLPEDLRPSRALLLLGAAWAATWTLLLRGAGHLIRFGHLRFSAGQDRRLLIVGGAAEAERTLSLLQRVGAQRNYLGRIAPTGTATDQDVLGQASRLPVLADLYRAEELIFCSADLSIEDI
ncbi:MAG: hypothetical protein AAGA31_13490 [Bacteroidota bacterium]